MWSWPLSPLLLQGPGKGRLWGSWEARPGPQRPRGRVGSRHGRVNLNHVQWLPSCYLAGSVFLRNLRCKGGVPRACKPLLIWAQHRSLPGSDSEGSNQNSVFIPSPERCGKGIPFRTQSCIPESKDKTPRGGQGSWLAYLQSSPSLQLRFDRIIVRGGTPRPSPSAPLQPGLFPATTSIGQVLTLSAAGCSPGA